MHYLRTLTILVIAVLVISCSSNGIHTATSDISIILPSNIANYKQQMTEYIQAGGKDPFDDIAMIHKHWEKNAIQQLAETVAKTIFTNYPRSTNVTYFKIVNHTAYIEFEMDNDGWAGVAVTQGQIRPLVTMNLIQYPQINHVVFGQYNP